MSKAMDLSVCLSLLILVNVTLTWFRWTMGPAPLQASRRSAVSLRNNLTKGTLASTRLIILRVRLSLMSDTFFNTRGRAMLSSVSLLRPRRHPCNADNAQPARVTCPFRLLQWLKLGMGNPKLRSQSSRSSPQFLEGSTGAASSLPRFAMALMAKIIRSTKVSTRGIPSEQKCSCTQSILVSDSRQNTLSFQAM